MSRLKKRYEETIKKQLLEKFGYKNVMMVPYLEKIVISMGIAEASKDKNAVQDLTNEITLLSGQKPIVTRAKKAISNFKLRQDQPIGLKVTLRGKRMYDFIDRLINIALPRTRDFRGLSARSIDAMGNYTFGIKEHTIFPETADEDIKDIFSLAVTVVTTSKDKVTTKAFLEHLGFPLKKAEQDVAEAKEASITVAKKKDKSKA